MAKVNFTKEEREVAQLRAFRENSHAAQVAMNKVVDAIAEIKVMGLTHEQACEIVFLEALGWQQNAKG